MPPAGGPRAQRAHPHAHHGRDASAQLHHQDHKVRKNLQHPQFHDGLGRSLASHDGRVPQAGHRHAQPVQPGCHRAQRDPADVEAGGASNPMYGQVVTDPHYDSPGGEKGGVVGAGRTEIIRSICGADKLKSGKILRVPGAYNPLTAKLIEEIGYDAVYVSGGVMANDLGFPDIGLTTLQDVSTRSYLISRVTNLPTIVDIDTGFKSCRETIETFEDFGVSAVHLEDQIERKRCGHLDNKELISTDDMVKKIKECVSAKKDKNFKIIARSDAKSVEGIDKMIERCKAYIDAGAEIVFPEALQDEKEFEKVRKELSCYLLANMTEFGKSKLFNYKELEKLGYNIVIYPVTTQRLAMKNVEDGLRDIYANGHQNNILDKMQTRKRLYELVDYEKYNSLDEKIYNFSTEGHE